MKALIDSETHRICSSCNIEKQIELFDRNKECLKGRTRQCKECRASKTRQWYADNRLRRRQESNERNQNRRDECIDKLGGKCMRCNESFPRCVYDFHHRDVTTKVNAISNLLRKPKLLWEELKKCDLLCANCHRIVHFEEGKVHESAY
jgi:hypothetical protein